MIVIRGLKTKVYAEIIDRDARKVMQQKARRIMDEVGKRVIEWLQSYTTEMRPPAFRGGPMRPAHPGHWADVTKKLRDNYRKDVQNVPGGLVKLKLSNGTPYAVYLEHRDGFFVLTGVLDHGGPYERIFKQVVGEMAPDWKWGIT